MRNKCCHLIDFVIDKSVDIFCMSETLLHDDDFASTPETNDLHHVLRPDKKRFQDFRVCGSSIIIREKKNYSERFL